MKQKLIGDILYVFDITPYEITEDTSAEIIKVQEECVAGFKELNESLADKIVAYNYHVMCVQVPEWAPYVDEPDPTPKEDPELAWSTDSATVTIGADDNVFPTLTNPHSVTVTYASGDPEYATINENTGEITLVAAGSTSIYANFAGDETYEAQTVSYILAVQEAPDTYTITIDADGLNDQNAEFKINNETVPLDGSYTVNSGSYFEFWPLTSYSDFAVTGLTLDDTAGSEHWYSGPIYADAQYDIHYKG